jgi:four helix bundle protein
MVKSYRHLDVWQRANAAGLDVYRVTSLFPRGEQFAVVSQLRCAAYSIPANIAEGFGRRPRKELLHFLAIANGSLEELRYFLSLSCDLRYLSLAELEKLYLKAAAQIISALAKSLRLRLADAATRAGSSDSSRNTGHVTRITETPEGLH